MPTKVKFYDKNGNVLSLDEILVTDLGGRLVMLTSPEYEAHEGHAFTIATVDETLADAETINICFKTCSPTGMERAHFYAGFSTLVGGSLELLESPTWTTNTGTATAIINRGRQDYPNRSAFEEDKTYTPTFMPTNKLLVNVTGLAGGTSLWKRYAWGEKGKIEAGDYRAENEFLLKCGTQYAVVFTAIGASNKGQIILNWIEH